MALTGLTNDQKITLQKDQRFRDQVRWAILDKARYWSQHNGADPPGGNLVRWAKSRALGYKIMQQPDNIGVPEAATQFCVLLTSPVWNDETTFSVDSVIDYMLSESLFDQLADAWFEQQISQHGF